MNKFIIALVIAVVITLIVKHKEVSEMTLEIVDKIIKFIILKNEGGYVNDPDDPGGETKYGISKRSYPSLNIPNLTLDKAAQIYRSDYFAKLPIILNPNLLYQVLDMAINAGPGTALKLYKEGMSVDEYKKKRLTYYASLKNWNLYKKSWTNRTNRNFA